MVRFPPPQNRMIRFAPPLAAFQIFNKYHAGGNCRIHDFFGGAEYPEYVMHGSPKYRNMLGKFSPSLCFSANIRLTKAFRRTEYRNMFCNFLHKAFPGMLQVITSNGMVTSW